MIEGRESGAIDPVIGFRTGWTSLPSGAKRRIGLQWLLQRLIKLVCWAYLRLFHDFRIRYHPGIPTGRPYVAVISHTSILDVPALIAADPFDPPTSMVIKSVVLRLPGVSRIVSLWGAVPVDRRGRDVAAIRQIRKLLSEGRGICVAPSGTRSVDGRLGPVNPVLVRLIVQSDAAVFPVAIVGTRECLPKGARLPRPGKIYVDSGPEIDLSSFRGRRLSDEDLLRAATQIRDAIAALLPDSMQPAPECPVLGTYLDET